jgi:hypothetical protein
MVRAFDERGPALYARRASNQPAMPNRFVGRRITAQPDLPIYQFANLPNYQFTNSPTCQPTKLPASRAARTIVWSGDGFCGEFNGFLRIAYGRQFAWAGSGENMRTTPSVAALVGRTAAACVHPYAAWRVKPTSFRVVMVSVYAAAGYVLVLATLLIAR